MNIQSKTETPDSTGWNFSHTYAELPDALFTAGAPVPVKAPALVVVNTPLAESLGLDLSAVSPEAAAALFSGNALPDSASPLAQAYGGHQFGHFAVLGDGRAHLIGEHVTPDGRRFDIQFKGSGQTPYSRAGDGRAALGPMLREYIISEALFALGIPTTRSLAVVTTGEPVYRDDILKGAILTRVAQSHLRVGTFEYAARLGDKATLQALADYAIQRHAPDAADADFPALALLDAVLNRQVELIVHWMRVGFIHGVMNTDNMTISGESIDFGPCAFMDAYDPATVFSSIDYQGRYAFGNQPRIAAWNLTRLAEALLPLIDEDTDAAVAKAEAVLSEFQTKFETRWLKMMRGKLGLVTAEPDDVSLASDLLDWMKTAGADYTNTFRVLTAGGDSDEKMYRSDSFTSWVKRWHGRRDGEGTSIDEAAALMAAHNPQVIPRNHKVEEALAAANDGDLEPMTKLLDVLSRPYDAGLDLADYQHPPGPDQRVYQTFCGT